MGAVGPDLRHRVRVAAHLARLLQRQAALEPAALGRERTALARYLGVEGTGDELRTAHDERLRRTDGDDPEAWALLVATARDDVAVAKPGYDDWEGE